MNLNRRQRSASESKRWGGLLEGGGGGALGLALLSLARSLRVVGVVAAVELLAHLPVLVFCFLTVLCASAVTAVLQQPWHAALRLTRQQWPRVVINGLLLGLVWLLWAKGLQSCGALRTVVVEHSQACVAGLLALLAGSARGSGGLTGLAPLLPLKSRSLWRAGAGHPRGEVLFLAGFVILFYHGAVADPAPAPAAAAAGWAGLVPGGAAPLERQAARRDLPVAGAGAGAGTGAGAGAGASSALAQELGLVAGLLMLVASALLGAVRDRFAAKVAREVGGAKRLHALSLLSCAALCTPLVVLDLVGEAVVGADYDYSVLSWDTWAKVALVGVLVLVLQFYTAAVAQQNQLPAGPADVASLLASFLTALVLVHFEVASDGSPMDHERFYYPLVLAWLLAVAALVELALFAPLAHSPVLDSDGEDGGSPLLPVSSSDGLGGALGGGGCVGGLYRPLSRLVLSEEGAEEAYASVANSSGAGGWGLLLGGAASDGGAGDWSQATRRMYRHVMSSPDSRKIAIFLSINLVFMSVEITVGLYSNSLGLISDAGHMFFDSMALFIGLFASYVSKFKPDRNFAFGYGRWETLCGFVNGVFLVFIAVFIMTESLERLSEPPELHAHAGLLVTSVLGFCVNLVGLVFFHDHAHLGSDEECSHGHSHGNDNMHGVFLHVLADALGSFGVIVSSLLVMYKDWHIADPLCSLMISVLILLASVPLLRSTASTLLLLLPQHTADAFGAALGHVLHLPSVLGVREPQLFFQTPSIAVASLHVVVEDHGAEQEVARLTEEALRLALPSLRFVTVQAYTRAAYHALLDNKGASTLPLFWDYGTGQLVYTADGLLSPEQKRAQQEESARRAATRAPPRAPVVMQHGHSHGGQPCHGHGVPPPQALQQQLQPSQQQQQQQKEQQQQQQWHQQQQQHQQQHGHSHGGQPCHGHEGTPALPALRDFTRPFGNVSLQSSIARLSGPPMRIARKGSSPSRALGGGRALATSHSAPTTPPVKDVL